MKTRDEIKKEFVELFEINLNGNWEHFKNGLEEIKAELVGYDTSAN